MAEPLLTPLWVAVIDDEPFAREWLYQQLCGCGYQVRSFASAEQFLGEVDGDCGVAVVDLQMPGTCGLGLQQQVSARQLLIPLVFVSGSNNLGGAVAAMRAGAIDFLEKPLEQQQLRTVIEAALARGRQWREQRAAQQQLESLLQRLTAREREILNLLLDGLTSRELADRLFISTKTAEEHRASLLRKMEVRNTTQLARLMGRMRPSADS